jgi:hypothetical protein
VCKFQVSGLIILHRNRFPICGQGRYGGPYRGFEGFLGRMGAHMHRRFSGRHAYMCACPLNKRALVHVKWNLRRALGARLCGGQARISARLWGEQAHTRVRMWV